MSTAYHAAYWAHALSLEASADTVQGLSRSIANARVDLNPHQVDAALFATRSPLSKGVILADEVGLGKTIEAGLVIAQWWAERRRRMLLILPATLRKQWQQELADKFGLASTILESATFNAARKAGAFNPFDAADRIIICSYHFAAAKADDVRAMAWDLVVIDEAHRLRNVYKTSSKMASAISGAVQHAKKLLLLTATPLQNSLMELYGLVSVIDPHVFGDVESYREQFVRGGLDEEERNNQLRERLAPVCTRTLRRQVLEYIRFTQRVPLTQEFFPSDDEHRLYELVSAYLQRPDLAALPRGQRHLMELVLRKILASSTFAIAGTLRKLIARLEGMVASPTSDDPSSPVSDDDFDVLSELAEEWEEPGTAADPVVYEKVRVVQEEVRELLRYAELAESIAVNTKGQALITALGSAFRQAAGLGAARKAVVFTESRRTQSYLVDLLSANGYDGQIVIMNGTNADPGSRAIFAGWLERHRDDGSASGSRTADTKAAIVEEFRDRATILIATESAAEGVNLQFCSLVVNYDLPWNPQRIEQRIGRCHRYGQQHDVVVVNFLNKRNAADQRVYQLLAEKFRLFDGVFGSSDEVLGALESGVDLERRIAHVYQSCRSADDIQLAFDLLQRELDEEIAARMADTRRAILDHFDNDVHARLRVHRERAMEALDDRQRWLWRLTHWELQGEAEFEPERPRFRYHGDRAPRAFYNFDWRDAEEMHDVFYRADHGLAQGLVSAAKARELPAAPVRFDLRGQGGKQAVLEPFVGQRGWLELSRLTVTSLRSEEMLVLAAVTDGGETLDDDLCRRLLDLPARLESEIPGPVSGEVVRARETRVAALLAGVNDRNGEYFDEEVAKLERWADDLRMGLERELKELDRSISEARRGSLAASVLADKLAAQRQLKSLEAERARKRRDLYEAQDAIAARRDEMIGAIERQLEQRNTVQPLFTIRWSLA